MFEGYNDDFSTVPVKLPDHLRDITKAARRIKEANDRDREALSTADEYIYSDDLNIYS